MHVIDLWLFPDRLLRTIYGEECIPAKELAHQLCLLERQKKIEVLQLTISITKKKKKIVQEVPQFIYFLFKKSVKKRQKEHDYKNVEGSTSLQVTCISYIHRPNSVSNSVKDLSLKMQRCRGPSLNGFFKGFLRKMGSLRASSGKHV